MLIVNVNTGVSTKTLFTSETALTVSQIWDQIQDATIISQENFYILYNGRLATDFDTLSTGSANITPRIFGGKGGFGSMLRAIGAQIEKTTNREACRDLSGRRLRDINEEKRLKLWIEKQAERKEEAAERKKRKIEKLCSQPKHEFKDEKYEHERSVLTERISDAVEEGFKVAAATSTSLKRAAETEKKIIKKKKVVLNFGLDLDSDELDTSDDDSSNDSQNQECLATQQKSEDSSDNNSEDNNSNSDVSKKCKTQTQECLPIQQNSEDSSDKNSEDNNSNSDVSKKCKSNSGDEENSDKALNTESKTNLGDEVSTDEKTKCSDVTSVEKLAVSN